MHGFAQHLVDAGAVPGDQLALGPALFGAAEHVERAATQPLELRQQPEAAQHGRAIALLENTDLAPEAIVKKSLEIAGDLCIYTNQNHVIETL